MKKKNRMEWYQKNIGFDNHQAEIGGFPEKFVFVKVHKLLGEADGLNEDIIYGSACGMWLLNLDKCRKADYVLALDSGIVVGVYKTDASRWSRVEDLTLAERYLCGLKRYDRIVAACKRGGKDAKRVYFAKSDEECDERIKGLLGKRLCYGSDDKSLKAQNRHYSLKWDK